MKTLSLSIPYLILSTQRHLDGKRQIHARTPFGFIDISVKLLGGAAHFPLFDIVVEGDMDTWLLDHQVPTAFHHMLFEMVAKIGLLDSEWPIRRPCRVVIHFKRGAHKFSIAGYLNTSQLLRPFDLGAIEATTPSNHQVETIRFDD